jgi:MFS family permease
MMKLDEGNELLGLSSQPVKNSNVDNCLNNPKPDAIMPIVLSLAMGNAADAVEIICVGFIMSEMHDISSYNKEFLSAAVFMGMLFGGISCGYLSDKFGRHPCLMYSLALNTIAGIASAGAPNIYALIACRVVGGIGIGGSVPVVFSLGAEIFPAATRGTYLSVIASFWMVGAIFTALSAWLMLGDNYYGDKIMPGVGWRPFAVVSALPAIVAMLLCYLYIPESPRFLINMKRYEEAAAVVNSISAVQIEAADLDPSSSCDAISSLCDDGADARKDFPQGAVVSEMHYSVSNSASYVPIAPGSSSINMRTSLGQVKEASALSILFQGKLLRTSCTLIVIWFTLSFGSYGMSTWISELFADVGIGNPYAATFIFAMANLPGNLISMLYIETFGRRWLLSAGMCLAGASALGFAFDTSIPAVVVLCASLFNGFSVIGWNSLDCLSGTA